MLITSALELGRTQLSVELGRNVGRARQSITRRMRRVVGDWNGQAQASRVESVMEEVDLIIGEGTVIDSTVETELETETDRIAAWRTVLGATVGMGTGGGLLTVTAGVFIVPMQTALDWSRTDLTFLPIVTVIMALLSPIIGWAIDRYGARVIGLAGMAGLVFAYAGFLLLPLSRSIFYLLVIFIGLFSAASSPMPWTRGVAGWFDKRRGTAFGFVMCGPPLIAAIILPLMSRLIEDHGWRSGFLGLIVAVGVLGIPTVFGLFKERSHQPVQSSHALPDEGVAGVLKERRFWILVVCFATVSFAIGGFVTHMIPMLTGIGLTATKAGLVGSAFALSSFGGRIIAGILLDKLWPPIVASVCFLVPILGAQLLGLTSGDSSAALILAIAAAIMLGIALGAEGNLLAFFVARYFSMAVYARVYGIMLGAVYGGLALGGLSFARLYDVDGNYARAILIASICFLIAGLTILTIDRTGGSKKRGEGTLPPSAVD
jgi:MFS family permease